MPSAEDAAVVLHEVTKAFPGVVANDAVSLVARRGRVHAVIGENGAGKSTLMNILYGLIRPDEGTMEVHGRAVSLSSPADAIAAGIGMVHQHFKLADNLTVVENVILGTEPVRGRGRLDLASARARIEDIARRYGLQVDPTALVGDLGVGARQRVEIVKALFRGADVLILDEPTAVLTPAERTDLIRNLRHMAAEGLTVLFISHKLDEVLAVADDITVMRHGRTVATAEPASTTAAELARLMVGSALPDPPARASAPSADVALALEGVTVIDADGHVRLDAVDLQLRRGEILGVAGVEGNGQQELVDVALGLVDPSDGRIVLTGTDVTGWDVARRRVAGVACIPTDRHREGLLLDAPLWENRVLGHQMGPPVGNGWLVDRRAARRDTQRIVAEADVRTPSVDVLASALSGGNQQKLIIGREMAAEPGVLLAAHPTRGVDVGAQAAIWQRLADGRDAGMAVLLVSADLDELIAVADRIVVLLRGAVAGTFDPRTATPAALGAAMTGAAMTGADPTPGDRAPDEGGAA